jgi:FMN-dependent NADH-azoreductase
MSRLLDVSSSPRGSVSYSNQVAVRVIRELRQANPQAAVTVRDLAHDPLPHIDDDFVAATRSADGPRTEKQRAILVQSDALVDELLASDIIVIAAPMINFSVASARLNWIAARCAKLDIITAAMKGTGVRFPADPGGSGMIQRWDKPGNPL